MVRSSKIAVIGHKGYLGSHLKEFLQAEKHEIITYDCDLSDTKELRELFRTQEKPDVVIHLAGRFKGDLETQITNNLVITLNLLDLLQDYPNIHFIYSSSGGVYGNTCNETSKEGDVPNPVTYNGQVKLWCEQLIDFHKRKYNLKTLIFRFPSIYGGQNSKGVIQKWIDSINNKQKISINGDGEDRRSFIHIDDVCKAINVSIQHEITGIFNIANSEVFTLNELAALFSEFYFFQTEYSNSTENELKSMILDSDKFRKLTNWDSEISLKTYLSDQMNIG